MDINFTLSKVGLTEKEGEVYVELLKLGTVTLNEIAKRMSYPRSTTFHTLNYLMEKGLVSKIIKEKISYYTASDPQKLQDQLDEKRQLLEEVLPELKSLKGIIKEPSSVEIYEGFKGIHTILADVCKVQQQVYYFGGYKKSLKVLKHLPNYVRKMRIEKKIPAKMIYDPVDEPILHTKEYQECSELRFLDIFEDFPCMIFIYGNKVSMFSFKTDLVGFIITNEDFSNAMQFMFNTYWEMAKPFEPRK